jgi:XapX domain-containing protein
MMRNLASTVRPALTFLLVAVLCGLVALQLPVPPEFMALVSLVLGYWFGERSKGK